MPLDGGKRYNGRRQVIFYQLTCDDEFNVTHRLAYDSYDYTGNKYSDEYVKKRFFARDAENKGDQRSGPSASDRQGYSYETDQGDTLVFFKSF